MLFVVWVFISVDDEKSLINGDGKEVGDADVSGGNGRELALPELKGEMVLLLLQVGEET